jgi:hypothetical protein
VTPAAILSGERRITSTAATATIATSAITPAMISARRRESCPEGPPGPGGGPVGGPEGGPVGGRYGGPVGRPEGGRGGGPVGGPEGGPAGGGSLKWRPRSVGRLRLVALGPGVADDHPEYKSSRRPARSRRIRRAFLRARSLTARGSVTCERTKWTSLRQTIRTGIRGAHGI